MKKHLSLLLLLSTTMLAAQNLIVNGDFSNSETNIRPECRANGGVISLHTEDLSWNKCGKLAIDKIISRDGHDSVSATVWIGGTDRATPGFPAKPDTTYRFSVDIKGNAPEASVHASCWDANGKHQPWALSTSTVGKIAVQSEWTNYKGTFKTPPGTTRAALRLQMWWNTQHGPLKHKAGDYILFDNITVEEVVRPAAIAPAATATGDLQTVKAVAAPQISGPPDEAQWKNAPPIEDFVILADGKSTPLTAVRALATADAVYIAADCREPGQVNDDNREDGASIWKGDVVELFWGPQKNDRLLSQFAVGAGGGRFQGNGSSSPLPPTDRWTAKTSRMPDGYRVEFNIPFTELGFEKTPPPGTVIPFNIARQRKATREIHTWSPMTGSLHQVPFFGELVVGGYGDLPRSAYEQQAARKRQDERRAKFASRKLAAAPVPVTGDFSIPFLPDAVFTPPERIDLTAAVNEIKPLPLAVANFSGKSTACRVTLEADLKRYNHAFGLAGFPAENITIRHGIAMRDSNQASGELIEALPKLPESFTVNIPAEQAALLWIDFDTTGVKPGVYHGVLRLDPLNRPADFAQNQTVYHQVAYQGEMVEVPVSLTVRDITLDREPALPFNGFNALLLPQTVPNHTFGEDALKLYFELGGRTLLVGPYSFKFPVKDGKLVLDGPLPESLASITANIRRAEALARSYGTKLDYMVAFSVFRSFKSMYPKLDDDQFVAFIRGIDNYFKHLGIANADYRIELWDEPPKDAWPQLLRQYPAVKNALPEVRLTCTLGAHITPADMIEPLVPYVDEWMLWDHGFFRDPAHLAVFDKARKAGKKISHYTCDTSPRSPLDRNYRRNAWFGEYHRLDSNSLYQYMASRGGAGHGDWRLPPYGNIILLSFGQPVPTLRCMALRQGMTDVKYLAELRRLGTPEALEFLNSAARRVVIDFGHDPAMPDNVREEAAALLLKHRGNLP
jgi:hypothetical protein